jgi:hypothetical protein
LFEKYKIKASTQRKTKRSILPKKEPFNIAALAAEECKQDFAP